MGGKCKLCPYNNILFLQFDHLENKDSNISQLRDKSKILLESKKCQLLCPNCHFKKSKNESFKQICNDTTFITKNGLISRNTRNRNRDFIFCCNSMCS